jgi:serine phosphatase RsbU (regulator of sigma subunit)
MERLLLAIRKRFWPELGTASGIERVAALANVAGFSYSAPLALLGVGWLIAVTDLALIQREWPMLLLLFALALLFRRLRFFIFLQTARVPISAGGALDGLITWAGALLFGPTALWLETLLILFVFARRWRQFTGVNERWEQLRNLTIEVTAATSVSLVALALYERWGGAFPLPDLAPEAVLPALYATLTGSLLGLLVWVPYIAYTIIHILRLSASGSLLGPFIRVITVGLILPAVIVPFATLAAGLYAQNGLGAFLFLVAGLLLVSLLARQLSHAVEHSQQRSRELDKLEQLGRAIITAPPDASTLPELLRKHVPDMFPSSRIEIRHFSDQILVHHPEDWPVVPAPLWEWVRATAQTRCFLPRSPLPWEDRPSKEPLVVAPVLDTETEEPIGGIYVAPRRDATDVASLLPAVQSLAAQIASTLHSAQVYARTLAHQRVEQELTLAGEIQASFLPDALPEVPGWQLAVTLEPAAETSGDFYDVISLPNGRLGMLIADVADKGMGAALYMALSRTLIRTYAVEHHARPDFVLRVANNRILMDTQVDLFVTLFYGVLDPLTSTLTYCNAGHNPPHLWSTKNGGNARKLSRTGIPLGVFGGQTWEQRTVQFAPGDTLVLYTDGVTEAQDRQGAFFGEQRLMSVTEAHLGRSAQEMQAALLRAVHTFVGDAPQFDDIAMMVVMREA